jgi:hypothetical protein
MTVNQEEKIALRQKFWEAAFLILKPSKTPHFSLNLSSGSVTKAAHLWRDPRLLFFGLG